MNELKTGDKIKIFKESDVQPYKDLCKHQGFKSHRKGNYIIVDEPFLFTTNYGNQIKMARKKMGMSRNELADLMGVKPVTVLDWEFGRRMPQRWKELQKILGI